MKTKFSLTPNQKGLVNDYCKAMGYRLLEDDVPRLTAERSSGEIKTIELGFNEAGELVAKGEIDVPIMDLIRQLQFVQKFLKKIHAPKKSSNYLLKGALSIIDLEK